MVLSVQLAIGVMAILALFSAHYFLRDKPQEQIIEKIAEEILKDDLGIDIDLSHEKNDINSDKK